MQLRYCRIRKDEERSFIPCFRIFRPPREILEIFIRESRDVTVSRARILLIASLFKELYSACSFSIVEFAKMNRALSCLASAFSVHGGKSSRFSLENQSRDAIVSRIRILLVASLSMELYSTCSFSIVEFAKMKRGPVSLASAFSTAGNPRDFH